MANKKKLTYIAACIAIGWIGSAALINFFVLLAHFFKSTTAGIILFFIILYSCLFGVLGRQVYAWKGRRDR